MEEEETTSAGQAIKCMVCGRIMKTITNTHLKRHGMTCDEYRVKFPDVKLGVCEWFSSWRDSDKNKEQLRQQNKRVYSDNVIKEKMALGRKRNASRPEYRRKLSESLKRYSKTEKAREQYASKPVTRRMKMSNFQRWVSKYGIEEAYRRQKDWQIKNVLPGKSHDTKCELMVESMLSTLGVKFLKQFIVGRYYCDFYLPEKNLVIEVFGDYWHANPKRFSAESVIGGKKLNAQSIWENDRKRVDDLITLGHSVMIIWESDVKTMTAQRLLEDIVHHCEKSQ